MNALPAHRVRQQKKPSVFRRLSPCLFVCVILLGVNPRTGLGQAVHDYGTWLSVNTQGGLDTHGFAESRMKWWFDGHLRFAEDAGDYNQSIVRPGIGYQLNENTTLWAGYAWIHESPVSGAPNFDENRIWQQLTWSHQFCQSNLSTRTRLEQRFVETGDDTGWRFRQMAKVDRPLELDSRLSFVLWDEAFFDLNSTDWGQHGSFSQNRVFVGLGWKFESVHNTPKIEVGYFNQFIRKRSDTDRFNHIVAVNWFWNF